MDYEKLHKDTLAGLQRLVSEGKISEEVAKSICADFVAESEDERIRKKLVEYISDWKEGQMRWNSDKEFCSRALAYLEKQKEQKPAEWSEEDERICKGLKELIPQCMTAQGYNRYYNWLNNLHNRIHAQANWKPSEEQLSRLQFALNLLEEKCDNVPEDLWNLYDNLKKL